MFNYKKIPKLIIFIFFMNSLFNLLSHSSTSIGSSPTLVWNCGIRYFFEEAPGRLFNFYLFINIFALWTGSFFLFLLISLENWDSFGVNVSFNQREASHEKTFTLQALYDEIFINIATSWVYMKITTSRPCKEMGNIIIGCEIKFDLSSSVASFAWGF